MAGGTARSAPARGGSRDDELPLPLAIGPVLPGRVEPEQAVPCERGFDSEEWRFSVDWAGMRVVLSTGEGGEVRLHDERLRDVTAALPEIAAAAVTSLRGRAAALDGVVAVLDGEGCPHLGRLADRMWARPAQRRPVVMLVTDLLHLDGASLLSWPFDRRRAALASVLQPAPHLQLPDWVEGHGAALAAAAAGRGLAAVLARHGQAPYHPGTASPQRLRIPLRETADCVVAGVVAGAGRAGIDALLLAEWDGGVLVPAGRVPGPASPAVLRWLLERTRALRTPAAPLTPDAEERGAQWLRPSLVATVGHHGRSEDGRLRLPSIEAVREDRPVRCCNRREPVAPPALPAEAAFRPLVINTLPLGDG